MGGVRSALHGVRRHVEPDDVDGPRGGPDAEDDEAAGEAGCGAEADPAARA